MALPYLTCLSHLLSIIFFLFLLRLVCSLRFLLHCLHRYWRFIGEHLQTYQYFTVPQYHPNSQENPLYCKVAAYIASLPSLEDANSASFFSGAYCFNELSLHLGPGDTVYDSFLGARVTWTKPSDGHDHFVLRIARQDRVRVFRRYLRHVESHRCELLFFTHTNKKNGETRWISMPFTHPATFDTLAIDPEIKKQVCADLESFMRSRSYYRRVGRVWHRCYFFHGLPGTGKSSFAIAMARALRFDTCVIDMSRCSVDILETLLLHTKARSLILLENLDLYLNKTHVSENTSIGSILDRVITCCGDERVMVFTMTGGEDLVDCRWVPLGKFDMCVYFPMCDFSAFKKLADRYLGVREHNLFQVVREGFQRGMRISHGRVGEIMLANRESPTRAIKILLDELAPPTVACEVGSSSSESESEPKPIENGGDSKLAIVRGDGRGGKSTKSKITKIRKLANFGSCWKG